MTVLKSILFTIIFYVFIQISSLWIILLPESESRLLIVNASSLINSIITLVLFLIIFNKREVFIFKGVRIRYIFIAIIAAVGFVFSLPILGKVINHQFPTNIYDLKFSFEKLKTPYGLDLILLTPIVEELFFRNYIQKGLTKNYKPITAIILSALLFSMIHIQFPALFLEYIDFSLNNAYFTFFGGLISGILYFKSKSIYPSILFHMIWNFMIIITR